MSETGDLALAQRIIGFIRENGLTFCAGHDKLAVLLEAVRRSAEAAPEAAFVEAGVAMGGSAMVIAAAKPRRAPLYLFDVFEMLPPPTEADGPKASAAYAALEAGAVADRVTQTYLAHADDLLPFVQENFATLGLDPAAYNVSFRKGLFEETLHVEEPVAFLHVDCDWYDSVRTCLDRVAPKMAPGGVILFDYYTSYAGCRKAVDEWLAGSPPFEVVHRDWTLAVRRRP